LLGVLLLVIGGSVVLLFVSFNQVAIVTGQNEAQNEIDFLQLRLDEIADNLLLTANQVANDQDIVITVTENDQQRLGTLALNIASITSANRVEIINADGDTLLSSEEHNSGGDITNEEQLLSLALLGSEVVRVIEDPVETEEHSLLLAVALPLIASDGEQVGALLVGRELNDEFWEFANFGRQSNHLALIYQGEVIAQTSITDNQYDFLTVPEILNPEHINQAQRGLIYIDETISFTDTNVPQLYAHMPVIVGGRISSVLAVAIDMQDFFALRNTVLRTLSISFIVLMVTTAGLLVFALRQSVIIPIRDMQSVVNAIMRGDYDQRIATTSKDEIGELGSAFNTMTQTILERQTDLADLNSTLEQRIDERTIELKKARDEALAAQRIANENSRLKSEFLSTMSHELRTPLNAIEGFTSIMLGGMGIELSARAEDMVKRISSNSKRLLHLINDFLDLSRIESGRLELTKEPLSLERLARKWESEVGILAEEKQLGFAVNVSDDLPPMILGDEDALSKIAINLLSNAFKFTHEGQVTLDIQRVDAGWTLAVTDTGIGIPSYAREYIFDEFRQVDGSSKRLYGGTGLGLALVQKLARAMGGNVILKSEVDEGSTFIVTLPLEIAKENQEGVVL
ncbi:MAG: ATP-binding protein, partial [Chloroflexota bacterium]